MCCVHLSKIRDENGFGFQKHARRFLEQRARRHAVIVLQRRVRLWLARRHTVSARGDSLPPSSEPLVQQPTATAPVSIEAFHHRRGSIVSRRFIPAEPVSLRGEDRTREALVQHRLLPYSHRRPLNSVPHVHACYKLSITNCLWPVPRFRPKSFFIFVSLDLRFVKAIFECFPNFQWISVLPVNIFLLLCFLFSFDIHF